MNIIDINKIYGKLKMKCFETPNASYTNRSVLYNDTSVITCPTRFREDWTIIENAAEFAFGPDALWTSLSEIKLKDKNGQSAGNIDYVLVRYNEKGQLIDFVSLEVQGVYISGNLRNPFEAYIKHGSKNFEWPKGYNYPKPDYLSSSRKRLIPQMLYKGGIFQTWKKGKLWHFKNPFLTRYQIFLPQQKLNLTLRGFFMT